MRSTLEGIGATLERSAVRNGARDGAAGAPRPTRGAGLKGASVPLAYYSADGPFGQLMRDVGSSTDEIGVIGLGAGALAFYLDPSQTMTFYEIDRWSFAWPRIALSSPIPTTLREPVEYVVGDGRLSLEQPHPPFGLLIVDAFSSDAIPTHLLTVEALQAYLAATTREGVIAFHTSNRTSTWGR